MGEITHQTKEELRYLPHILGKVLGGIVAVIGCAGWVLNMTRHAGGALPWFLVGVAGFTCFIMAGRALARRGNDSVAVTTTSAARLRINLVAWGLFLLLVIIFLTCSWLLNS